MSFIPNRTSVDARAYIGYWLRVISIVWMAVLIEAVDVRKTYRVGKVEVPALRGISFSVQKGEFVSVVGPSARVSPPNK